MWIEIFKSGKQTDSSGRTENYTAEKLDEISNIYNGKISVDDSFTAPLVKGHPVSDNPAFGWVERLARRGDKLLAKLKDLSPDIIKDVRNGKFRKISIALYPDLMLRHVGLLGAAAPAVKGLRNLKFEDAAECRIYVSEVQNKNDEKEDNKEIEERKFEEVIAENEKLSERIREYEQRIESEEKNKREKQFREFTNSLIDNNDGMIVTPAQAEDLVGILENAWLADNETGWRFDLTEEIKSFVQSLEPVRITNELGMGFPEPDIRLNDFGSKNVMPERLEIHQKALEYMYSNPGMSYEESVLKIQREEF